MKNVIIEALDALGAQIRRMEQRTPGVRYELAALWAKDRAAREAVSRLESLGAARTQGPDADPFEQRTSYCRYDLAWRGPCMTPCDGDICEAHKKSVCSSCGEQASRECSHTGQFVCGAPLCDNCDGYVDASKPSGGWGFMNHTHRKRITQAAKESKE